MNKTVPCLALTLLAAAPAAAGVAGPPNPLADRGSGDLTLLHPVSGTPIVPEGEYLLIRETPLEGLWGIRGPYIQLTVSGPDLHIRPFPASPSCIVCDDHVVAFRLTLEKIPGGRVAVTDIARMTGAGDPVDSASPDPDTSMDGPIEFFRQAINDSVPDASGSELVFRTSDSSMTFRRVAHTISDDFWHFEFHMASIFAEEMGRLSMCITRQLLDYQDGDATTPAVESLMLAVSALAELERTYGQATRMSRVRMLEGADLFADPDPDIDLLELRSNILQSMIYSDLGEIGPDVMISQILGRELEVTPGLVDEISREIEENQAAEIAAAQEFIQWFNDDAIEIFNDDAYEFLCEVMLPAYTE